MSNELDARTFGDFLTGRGMQNQVEPEHAGAWAVWVHNEDELEGGRRLLEKFLCNPAATEFRQGAQEARARRQEAAAAAEAAGRRSRHGPDAFAKPMWWGMPPLTAALVILSVGIWLIMQFSQDHWVLKTLLISTDDVGGGILNRIKFGLYEVRHGQVWRLVTPILMHDQKMILHIFFNMYSLRILGSLIEMRLGMGRLLALVFVVGVVSNVAQYLVSGPWFYGMSGVVYGLFGFIWLKGRFDPRLGFELEQSTVATMLIWLGLCFALTYFRILPIANTVHVTGLLVGMAWGYLSALRRS